MIDNSHAMAELLTSLTKHFDLCVTAVRTTEGGPALARIKAAEATQSQEGDDVSISGVILDQGSHMPDLQPLSPEDRAQMLEVLVQDSSEVEDVIQELNERLHSVEMDFNNLDEQTTQVRLSYLGTLDAFRAWRILVLESKAMCLRKMSFETGGWRSRRQYTTRFPKWKN